MIAIEYCLMKNRKQILPIVALFLVMVFMAFIDYWIGNGQKHLEGGALAGFVSGRAFQSGIMALFFIFWMLQTAVHLNTSGFYKMLLVFGWSRNKLFIYSIFQVIVYAGLFILIDFLCYAVLSFFYNITPLELIMNTDFNAMFAQYFYLFMVGSLGMAIAFLRPGYVMLLPVFIYWLIEGWAGSYLQKKMESSVGEYFPLNAMNKLVAENLLGATQIGIIALYALAVFIVLSSTIQKKMFL